MDAARGRCPADTARGRWPGPTTLAQTTVSLRAIIYISTSLTTYNVLLVVLQVQKSLSACEDRSIFLYDTGSRTLVLAEYV